MFNPTLCTTSALLDLLQWIQDRHQYRIKCGIRDGANYAADTKTETIILYELSRRGYPHFNRRATA